MKAIHHNAYGTDQHPLPSSEQVVIWQFIDGRAGHRSQVTGLSEAIARFLSRTEQNRHSVQPEEAATASSQAVVCCEISVTESLRGLRCILPHRLNRLADLPSPDLLIAAGHATHLPVLAACRRFGGRSVVLMNPSLPRWLFDRCLIPRADNVRNPGKNVILTEGALNRITSSDSLNYQQGLILVGGPSPHFGWSDSHVISQLKLILGENPDTQWTLTTSRRTPSTFLTAWKNASLPGKMVPVEQTHSDWLPTELKKAGQVWVTSDSVSMIYESLTSGASVGLLELPEPQLTRVTQGIQSLIARQIVTSFQNWKSSRRLTKPPVKIAEADRCAERLVKEFQLDRSELRMATLSRTA